jgi:hypothetical protein
MEQSDLLRYTVAVLEELGARYFVTGSTASIFFGEPRFTNDLDIVVDLHDGDVARLCAEFPPPEFYLSEEAARRAVAQKGSFNILQPASGLKVDVIVPADSMFNRSRFSRLQRIKTAADLHVCFTSAEDVIIKKMEFFREGGAEKHLRDITGILKVSGEALDYEYIKGWAENLGLETIWRTILRKCRFDEM